MFTDLKCKVFILLTWLLAGCDPEEKIPAYLTINDINLTVTDPAVQGSASEKIVDAWVYIDNQLLGVYELPARFPVLAEGNKEVIIGAGILENGISATRIIYPFYKGYQGMAEFIPGQTVNLTSAPEVNYFAGIDFPWRADFENGILKFSETPSSNVPVNLVTDPSLRFEGTHSATFKINSDSIVFDGEGDDSLLITTNQQTFLEMNYKCDQPFDVGVTVVSSSGEKHREYVLTVNRSAEWNKIYINLSPVINSNPSTSRFRVYLRSVLEDGRTESTFYVDNLKIVYI